MPPKKKTSASAASPKSPAMLIPPALEDGLLTYLFHATAGSKASTKMQTRAVELMERFVAKQEVMEIADVADTAARADAAARANFFHSPGPSMPPLTPSKDGRGSISNIAENSVGGVQVIFSAAGSTRAKHIHLTDTHVCYVVSGEVDYKEREVEAVTGALLPDTRSFHFGPGERFVTGPNIAHQMDFPVDTVLVVMSEHPRDAKSYDADIVRFTASL